MVVSIDNMVCRGCGLCIDACRRGVLELSSERGARGFTTARVTHPDRCTGCMECELICPDMCLDVTGGQPR
ncbi:MAG: 4Fe-4S binding protein [Firmicutes bacterium]|nr:4Fe-4S binding protein [Bacillota bacterium]